MIYFDNAATTFPKPRTVIGAVNKCIREYCGNPGRSSHKLALKSSEKIYEARESICELFNFKSPENVVFTLNASYALNLAIKCTVGAGEHILISDIEHNSTIRPVYKLSKDRFAEHDIVSARQLESDVGMHIRDNTTLLICNLSSNVNGEKISLNSLYNIKQKYKIKIIADASQLAGHEEINLDNSPFDIVCAPSHKGLFGIQGAGFCIFCDDMTRRSFVEGGSGSESIDPEMPKALPEHFEAGTLPTPAIVSLHEGIRFVQSHLSEIKRREQTLTLRCEEMLKSIKNAEVFSSGSGILSFRIKNLPSAYIAEKLDSHGICVRSGLHCAPLIHKRLGTLESGTVRLSFSYFNKLSELDRFYKLMKEFN